MKILANSPEKVRGFCRTAAAYVHAALHVDSAVKTSGEWGRNHQLLLTAAEALEAILAKPEEAPEQALEDLSLFENDEER